MELYLNIMAAIFICRLRKGKRRSLNNKALYARFPPKFWLDFQIVLIQKENLVQILYYICLNIMLAHPFVWPL